MEQYIGDFQLLLAAVLIIAYMLWDKLFPD
ncbi:MAG: hypothetical protein K0R78_2603 [Pelosinus sp.]|jgi:hypothetical protein|nr:hypothetical protein [Pelosinus sp.]